MPRTLIFFTVLATCVAATMVSGVSTVIETVDCAFADKTQVRPEISFGLDQVASAVGFDFEHHTWDATTPDIAKEMAIWICHLDEHIRSVDLVAERAKFTLHWRR